jgi:DNA-directed RNA polymerase alpha subunit
VVEVEERNEDWRMELGSDYEKLIALINCNGSVDVHFFWDKF